MRRVFLFASLLALVVVPISGQSVEVADPYPTKGQQTRITVVSETGPVEGAVVEVIYRPNSQTGSTETLPPTDSAGSVDWTPIDAGIVTLNARENAEADETIATSNLSVRFGTFPSAGLMIMIVAGILLFGGAGLGFVMLFREGQAEIMAEEPPST